MARKGSPPRGRGKDDPHGLAGLLPGITPAWAGKRARGRTVWGRPEDHPRVGGEKSQYAATSGGILGSPPRGRGKG